MKAKKHLVWLLCITMLIGGCAKVAASWPIVIGVAQAIASLTTVVDPALTAFSQQIVVDLQTLDNDYNAYVADKTSVGAKATLVAAIEAIQANLPANLAALHISDPATVARVTAAVNIILDFVDSIAGQIPATAASTAASRLARGAGPIPKVPSAAQIRARWGTDVCKGDAACVALLK